MQKTFNIERTPDGTFRVLCNGDEVFRADDLLEAKEFVDQEERDEKRKREHLAMLKRQGLIR